MDIRLEDITPGAQLAGIAGDGAVTVVAVQPTRLPRPGQARSSNRAPTGWLSPTRHGRRLLGDRGVQHEAVGILPLRQLISVRAGTCTLSLAMGVPEHCAAEGRNVAQPSP